MTHLVTIRRLIVTLMLVSLMLVACGDEAADQAVGDSTETVTQPIHEPTATSTQAPATPTYVDPLPTATATDVPVPVVDIPEPPRAQLTYAEQSQDGLPGAYKATLCMNAVCTSTVADAAGIPVPVAAERLAVPIGAELIFTVDDASSVDITSVVAIPLAPQMVNVQATDQVLTDVTADETKLPVRETQAGIAIIADLPTASYVIVVHAETEQTDPGSISHSTRYSFRVITTPQPEDCSWSSSGVYHQFNSLEELAWASHRVIVGTVVEELLPVWGIASNSQEPNRRNIYTNYVFQVEQMLRGTPAETVLVRQYGGTIGDCSQQDMDARPLIPGDRLLLFLTKPLDGTRPSEPAYFFTGGPLSYFSVQPDGMVTTEAGILIPGEGLDLNVVIQRIHDTLAGPPALQPNDPLLVPIDESPAATATPGP